MENNQIKRRERARNWTPLEKQLLKNAIEPFLGIIQSKLNMNTMIEKKKQTWRRIAESLRPYGIDFPIRRIRQQYSRMQLQEKSRLKAKGAAKKDAYLKFATDTNEHCGDAEELSVVEEDEEAESKTEYSNLLKEFKSEVCTNEDSKSLDNVLSSQEADFSCYVDLKKEELSQTLPTENAALSGACISKDSEDIRMLCASEVSDLDIGDCRSKEHQQLPQRKKPDFKEQFYRKKLEQINMQIAHEAELHEIIKEAEMMKLELVKLQIEREKVAG